MNRYHGVNRGSTIGGPSKASPSTVCQKCLKKDNYECKANAQERPYVSRPSRTQQLLNPKLVPKLSSDVPQELLRKKGIADEQLAKAQLEKDKAQSEKDRGRKRERDDDLGTGASKRRRSLSSASSVSTISTNISRSPSPRETRRMSNSYPSKSTRRSRSPSQSNRYSRDSLSVSRSPPRGEIRDSEKKRRRDSYSSVDSYSSADREDTRKQSRERASSRSIRRRLNDRSPDARGRRTESRSPDRGRRRLSNDRRRIEEPQSHGNPEREAYISSARPPPRRERSLSPFSKRLALTQAMNRGQ
ncbi:zinc knuckle-domain-containing protein [Rutstroemia sp. NJR-2017a WRK4]|nr:zinc knuckle-domain-containing protein [Rutstroemia sp. NJR-2017a WRK4]